MVKGKRNKDGYSHFAPDPGMQRFAQNRDAAFIRIGEVFEKEASGDRRQATGNFNRHPRHKLLNHRTMGGSAVLKARHLPPRWSSEELLVKALRAEGRAVRQEAISALQRLGLKMWESHGTMIITQQPCEGP